MGRANTPRRLHRVIGVLACALAASGCGDPAPTVADIAPDGVASATAGSAESTATGDGATGDAATPTPTATDSATTLGDTSTDVPTTAGASEGAALVATATANYAWSTAGAVRRQVDESVSVLDLGARPDDDQDDSAAFAAAIDQLQSSGGVITVPAGRYHLSETMELSSGIVLRGEGPATRLVFDLGGRDVEALVAQGQEPDDQDWVVVTADLDIGDTSVVTDTSGIAVGDIVELEQDNDAEVMYTLPEWEVDWAEGSVGELAEIVEVGADALVLSNGVFGAYTTELGARIRVIDAVTDVGIEALSIERVDDGYGNTITFRWASNVWIDSIVSSRTTRAHVALDQVRGCDVVGSIIHDASDFGDGGRAYGVSVARHATSCLVANNTLYDLRHALIIQLGASGNVIAYNHARGSAGYADRQPRADISLHGHWPQANLLEGNIVDRVVFADWWGPSGPGNTLFRNCVLESVVLQDHSDRQVIVGNQIGSGGLTISDDTSNTVLATNDVEGANEEVQATDSVDLPPSLWADQAPDFLDGRTWPLDTTAGACDLPASAASPLGNQ